MSDLASLFSSMCRPRSRDVAPGSAVFQQGDPAADLFLVEAGMVRLVRYTACGEALTLFRATPGQTFAEAALFADVYHCTAVADVASSIACFPKKELLQGLGEQPAAMLELTALLSRQVRELRTLLEIRSIRSAEARVLQYLHLHADARSGVLVLPGTMKEFALDLGLAHETFYRTLASLEKKGEISRNGRSVLVCPPSPKRNRP